MEQYCDVVIIGAGASGLLCGGLLAEAGIPVTLLEKNARAGKKLSATGNGRCNFTNLHMDTDCYYGDTVWLRELLAEYPPERIIRQFHKLGVYHREREGYVYPYTNQAVTVVEALQDYCRRGGVRVVTDCKAVSVRSAGDRYYVRTPQGELGCRYLVLAAGGIAAAELGGSGSGYKLARGLGHRVHKTYPALTGLQCGGDWWNRVAGTRVQGRFSLRTDGRDLAGECGEIQIVRDGVSGIPVFQLCRVAAEALSAGGMVEGVIDFVPAMERTELRSWIEAHGIAGLVPKKWIPVLEGLSGSWRQLKEFTFPILGTFGMERAQVTMGGIPTEETNVETMESKMARNVYLTGELLDVDGRCGGYNLHFAWSCAMAAAEAICQREKGEGKNASDNAV